ncbi:MAG: hypothetical protein ACRCVV_21425 [Shewanella sp.]
MSEKMRDDFFEWYYQQEQFGDAHQEELLKAWQASRAAMAVELPSDIGGEYYADEWNAALACVEWILDDAGVSYK